MFKGSPNMRLTLYIVSILVNGAALVVRPVAQEWGDALQYVGGALAAITGAVAITNVERESTTQRIKRQVTEEVATLPPSSGILVRCDVMQGDQRCVLAEGHPLTYGHVYE